MKVILTNQITVIENPDKALTGFLKKELNFTDETKKYQIKRMYQTLKRMEGSLSRCYSQDYKDTVEEKIQQTRYTINKLKSETNRSVLKEYPEKNALIIPTALYPLLKEHSPNLKIEDRRTPTGDKISLPWEKKPFNPRDYQEEAIQTMEKNTRGIINLAMGLGKTLCAIHATRRIKKKTLIIVPGDSIFKQFYKQAVDAFGKHKVGIWTGNKKEIKDVTIGIVDSVYTGIELIKKENWGLIIWDEAHHCPADTVFSVGQKLSYVEKIFGLTATAYRSDGKDILINAICGPVLVERDIIWGVKHGWLAKPHFKIIKINTTQMLKYDKSGKAIQSKEKLPNYKQHVRECKATKDRIMSDVKDNMAIGKKVVCLVAEVAHGEELAKELNLKFAKGEDKKSQTYVDMFNKKEISGLIGTGGKISEGTDIVPVNVLILANFVASKVAVIQSVGRGLRPEPGKEYCEIYDYILTGSDMLARHAYQRVEYYKEITNDITFIEGSGLNLL